MKALTIKATQTRINAVVNSTSKEGLQELFINIVFHALIHSNIMPKQLKVLRDSDAPAKFKAAIAKHVPANWNKKVSRYEFDSAKQVKVCESLGLELGVTTLEALSEVLPSIFTVVRRESTYDRANYMVTVAHHLTANGEKKADEITAVMAALLANPELINKAARAIVQGDTSKAAKAA